MAGGIFSLDLLPVEDLPVGMPNQKGELMQGTLDLLILRVLQAGDRHGYAIARRIERISDEALSVPQGSLYPALQRLLKKGWIEASWGVTDTNRKARFYTLTAEGEKRLEAEVGYWKAFINGVNLVIDNA